MSEYTLNLYYEIPDFSIQIERTIRRYESDIVEFAISQMEDFFKMEFHIDSDDIYDHLIQKYIPRYATDKEKLAGYADFLYDHHCKIMNAKEDYDFTLDITIKNSDDEVVYSF
jgi:hypothetical protein